jgi:hypothetical protein
MAMPVSPLPMVVPTHAPQDTSSHPRQPPALMGRKLKTGLSFRPVNSGLSRNSGGDGLFGRGGLSLGGEVGGEAEALGVLAGLHA